MKQSSIVTQVHSIRSRIIKRYYQLEQGVNDGTIDPRQALLEHLYFQDIAPELDAIEEEARST
jgi:hypothetical protein